MFYQQGDVILEVIEKLPTFNLKNHDKILAKGEVTGHTHRVDLADVNVLMAEDGTLYCEAKEEFTVIHEEHKPLTLPKGTYKIRKVLEYDHFAEESKSAQD